MRNMTRQEIEEKVRAFLIDDLEIEEKNFGFKIKPEEMAGVTTLRQFCDYIESKVG